MIAVCACLAHQAVAVKYAPAVSVCVANKGGYKLEWWYEDTMQHTTGRKSKGFSMGHYECMDVNTMYTSDYNTLKVWNHAVAGKTVPGDYEIVYDPAGGVAGFECSGSTQSIHCTLMGISMPPQSSEEDTLLMMQKYNVNLEEIALDFGGDFLQ